MTAETGRRASRLELIRARLHESTTGRRCARDGDATPTSAAAAAVVRRPSPSTAAHKGIRPAPDRRGVDRLQATTVPAAGRHAEVKGRSTKLDSAGDEGPIYAQVWKPASSARAERGPTGEEGTTAAAVLDDSSVTTRRRPTQKTSSSSSLLSKSQNFFARLRSRKNGPSAAKSAAARTDGGSGNDDDERGSSSKRKMRRSVSDSGCAMYVTRELVNGGVVDASPPTSAHLDAAMTSSDDVTTGRPETAGRDVDASAATASVYAEVEPLTGGTPASADVVVRPTESTSGSDTYPCRTGAGVQEECSGSYSLREALMRRGGGGDAAAAATEVATSSTFSPVIRQRDSDDDRRAAPPRRPAQTTSLLPVGGGVAPGVGRVSGWRRRRLASAQSTGCLVGGRRDGRLLERIQEVDSPPGSAGDDQVTLRSPRASDTQQRVAARDSTTPSSDARTGKFIHYSYL